MFGANSFAAKLKASSCIVLASSVNPLNAKIESNIFPESNSERGISKVLMRTLMTEFACFSVPNTITEAIRDIWEVWQRR